MKRKGRPAEIAPLDLSDTLDLAAVPRGAAEALGLETNVKPTDAK